MQWQTKMQKGANMIKANVQSVVVGLIIFSLVGWLWFVLADINYFLAGTLLSIYMVSLCFIVGAVIGILGNEQICPIAGVVIFIAMVFWYLFFMHYLKANISVVRLIIQEGGNILAFSVVGFCGSVVGQRFKRHRPPKSKH